MRIDLLSDHDGASSGNAMPVAFGGRYLMVATGTFDSATATVDLLGPDGSTYVTVASASLTAAGSAIVYLPADATVKGTVTGGTSPTGIYLSIYRIPED